jgi:tungstate transport system substrate-binding protein
MLLAAAMLGCQRESTSPRKITLATTTSVQDSGLLDELLPRFKEQHGIDVQVVAVGSGQAIELGRRGDADVVVSHSPKLEKAFVAEGFGLNRTEIMKNDFVIVGPPADPAKLAEEATVTAALKRLADREMQFVSRGDQSGTHVREMELWKEAALEPASDWYIQAGSGMAATLRMASEKEAYTLTDRGTFLSLQDKLALTIAVERKPPLDNVYSVTLVNPEKHPHIQAKESRAFAEFLASPDCQQAIGQFGVGQFGQPLFEPLRLKP